MKAILLSAGHGTRLRPLTLTTPKCLIPINGIPLMTYWFNLFRKYGIDEVLINLSYLPEKVEEYIEKHAKDIKVHLYFENKLLGSLGTLVKNQSFFNNNEDVFIFYSDNLTNTNLRNLYNFHKNYSFPFTMGLFRTNDPHGCGIAELDESKTIIKFIEKPKEPESNLANAGIYVTSREVFNFINSTAKGILDIGFDLLPNLINHMKGYSIPEFLIDVGTLDNIKIAEQFVKKNPEIFNFSAE